ncbi:MAG: caspase family protein [Synechococcales bacterium]|nr:caspase family protein [Synechococcales bacterium]
MDSSVKQPRYYLIACGTKDYPNFKSYSTLESVEADLQRVATVLSKFGYQRVLQNDLSLNPTREALTVAFAEWLLSKDLSAHDRVIFYYSGHGHTIEGDRHYLLLHSTREHILAQTSLATDELVRPLINEGVNVSQILYIIDTCYAGQGVADISGFASKVFDIHQKELEKNRKSVHLAAASRLKQTAQEGVFSALFQSELERLLEGSGESSNGHHIQPSLLFDNINNARHNSQELKQQIVYNIISAGKEACFFPILPKKLLIWEANVDRVIEQLLAAISSREEEALFFINSFLLMSPVREDFVFEKANLPKKLYRRYSALGVDKSSSRSKVKQ